MYFKWCLGVPRCACVKSSLAGGTCSSGFDPIIFILIWFSLVFLVSISDL